VFVICGLSSSAFIHVLLLDGLHLAVLEQMASSVLFLYVLALATAVDDRWRQILIFLLPILRSRLNKEELLFTCRQPSESALRHLERLESLVQASLFNMLDVLRHDVVALGTMTWQLVCEVALEDVGASTSEVHDYLKLASMSC